MTCSPPKRPIGRLPGLPRIAVTAAILLLAPADLKLLGQPSAGPPPGAPARQIAPVMSHVHADWLVRPEREEEEHPDKLIAGLEIEPGSTVIDLGAGVGYFTWRLAQAVGPSGRVIATDIQPEMLAMLRTNLRNRGITNVTPVLATATEPNLPRGEASLLLMVDVYHELSHPALVLDHILHSLKPGGRLAIVEYRKEEDWIPIHPLHKMSLDQVRAEIQPAGFEFETVLDFLPRQHVVIFRRPLE